MAKFSKADWKLGAVYRAGLRFGLDDQQVVAHLVARCALNDRQAAQLVSHWRGSLPYRKAA